MLILPTNPAQLRMASGVTNLTASVSVCLDLLASLDHPEQQTLELRVYLLSSPIPSSRLSAR